VRVLTFVLSIVVLRVPETGQLDGTAVPQSDVRARDRDHGQFGHVLQVVAATRSALRATFPVRPLRKGSQSDGRAVVGPSWLWMSTRYVMGGWAITFLQSPEMLVERLMYSIQVYLR